jgi:DNA (cytosine-5)-methyltransferase 1
MTTSTEYRFIDIFCGIGGFHIALTKLGMKCIYACDIDKHCQTSYEKNHKIKPDGDITTIDIEKIPAFDVLCAGFPCQPFSKAGFQLGFNDERGNLFFTICKIVKYHKPKYLILENVRNLSTHDNGKTWETMYNSINALGYNTYKEPLILNTLHFDIPQNRERMIILCMRKDMGLMPNVPIIPKKPKTMLRKTLKDIMNVSEEEENKEYRISGKLKDVENIWDDFLKKLCLAKIDIPHFPIWTDYWDNTDISTNDPFYLKYSNWIDKNRDFYKKHKDILEEWLKTSRENKNWSGSVRKFEYQAEKVHEGMATLLWTSRGSGIRVKDPNYISTLVAMSMIPVYGPEHRKLSPKELLRLQSFPDTFVYDKKHIYKQIGNAVNVKMIYNCANFLIYNKPLFDDLQV